MTYQSSPLMPCLVALALTLAPLPAVAAMNQAQLASARSSFQYAERNDWRDAIAHAKRTGDPVLIKLITWESLLDAGSGASFEDIMRFVRNNSNWPEQKRLRQRAEMSLRDATTPDSVIMDFFSENEPISGFGRIALAEALSRNGGDKSRVAALIREAWRSGDFDENYENYITGLYSNLITQEDDVARVDRLLWEGKITIAKRTMPRITADMKKLFLARIALMEDDRNMVQIFNQVPSNLYGNPGLHYERIRNFIRAGQIAQARQLLLTAPDQLQFPAKWWKLREGQVRSAIDEEDYKMAARLLEGHGQLEGQEFAEASWLKGWLMLEFSGQPNSAADIFRQMYEVVKYPVSKSRGAYWVGRAYERAGNSTSARQWYLTASNYPTTFYGQVALVKMGSGAVLTLPSAPDIGPEEKRAFEHNELARAIRICVQLDAYDFASHLIGLVVETESDPALIAQVIEIGKHIGKPQLSVRGAKKAIQQNMVFAEAGYPMLDLPDDLPVESALALAITRQESEFDKHAQSKAGAMGMMQLLPGTAKEVARKIAVGYQRLKLREPGYNMKLGSHYLARLINSYSGSYVMAIAAYNAGPGNVRNWADEFGTPGNSIDSAINWIEKIPFSETRNYVQRVLENLQVYRYLENGSKPMELEIGDDLVR